MLSETEKDLEPNPPAMEGDMLFQIYLSSQVVDLGVEEANTLHLHSREITLSL